MTQLFNTPLRDLTLPAEVLTTKLKQQDYQYSKLFGAADFKVKFTERADALTGVIMHAFMRIFVEELHDETHTLTIYKPQTWWQHFKMTYFGPQLLRWFPVQYEVYTKTVRFEAGAYYPGLKLPFDSQVKFVQTMHANAFTEKYEDYEND